MNRRGRIAFKIAAPLLLFALGEWSARHVFGARSRIGVAERKTLAAYRGMPNSDQYFKDLIDCGEQSEQKGRPRYARYVLQDINEDCATPTVNYANRIRKTWNPDPAALPSDRPVYEVGMFGGSTMEGQGAIDDETIPSHFSKFSTGGNVVYHVTNYGVGGYTFTQSVVKFVILLREGHHFDGVVFYGGANDVDYAYEVGEAGGLAEEEMVRVRLEGGLWDKLKESGKEQLNACVLCLAASVAVRHLPLLSDYVTPVLVRVRDAIHFKRGQSADDDAVPLAKGIAEYYAQSHRMLVAIAEAYGVKHLEFWQPSLMYKDGYGPGEATLTKMDPRLTDAKLRNLYALSRNNVATMHLGDFVDLSHALDGRTRACYLDAVHLSGACNQIVAERIYRAWTEVPTTSDKARRTSPGPVPPK